MAASGITDDMVMQGAVGLAGLVAAIYPVESPGGYQLFGRTLPPWSTWGRGRDFGRERPWLLQPFDQIRFKVVNEKEYEEVSCMNGCDALELNCGPAA